jgi:hypothetical protein
MFGIAKMPGVDPVGHQIDRAMLLPQRVRDGGAKIGIVLYEQNAHGLVATSPA